MIATGGVAVTRIALEVPLMDGVTVSVAVTVWLPGVSKVTCKFTADPFWNVAVAGKMAAASVLVKWIVPLYPLEVLFEASSAVRFM